MMDSVEDLSADADVRPVTTSKGDLPVVLFTEQLYANSACGRIESHVPTKSRTRHLNRFPRLLLTTSVCPSV